MEEIKTEIKEEYSTDKNAISKFLSDSIKGLQEGDATNYRYKLDDRLAIFVGWSEGYGSEKRDDVIQDKEDPNWAINVGIKVWTSDDFWTDYDYLNYPYYDNGDVVDTGRSIVPNEDIDALADSILADYDDIKDFDIAENGRIIPEDESSLEDYDRRAVERDYELEDGQLDGVSIRDAEAVVGEDEGALDRYVNFEESLKETKDIDIHPLNGNWVEWKVVRDGKKYSGVAKVFHEPSEFGIRKGNVSKFEAKEDGKDIANFDRGWDIKPSAEKKSLIDEIVKKLEEYGKNDTLKEALEDEPVNPEERFYVYVETVDGTTYDNSFPTKEKALKYARQFIGDDTDEIFMFDNETDEYIWGWSIEELNSERTRRELGLDESNESSKSINADSSLKESIWNTDEDTESVKHLSEEEIKGLYDKFEIKEDETITDAYYEDGKLHVIIVNEKGETTDYQPEGDKSLKEDRQLKEEVSDEAYEIADEINNRFEGSEYVSWEDFDEAFTTACENILHTDFSNLTDEDADALHDVEVDVRGLLAFKGWESEWEGENEGGLKNINIEPPKKNSIILKALKEYEKAQIDFIGRNEKEALKELIQHYEEHELDEELTESLSSNLEIVKKFKDLRDIGRKHAILHRLSDDSYIIALGFDGDRWAQGRYDYKSAEDAEKDLEADYKVKELDESVESRKHQVLVNEALVEIDDDDLLTLLMNRLEHWDPNDIDRRLYREMYESYIDGSVFESGKFDPMIIVDNDWVNYCDVIGPGDEFYDKVLECYERDGLGDISTEEDAGYSYIEASTEEGGKTYFLCRW